MGRTATILVYLCPPALLAIDAFAFAFSYEAFGTEMLMTYLVEGFLFYAAPYLLWAIVAGIARFSSAVLHAGLVAASVALAAMTITSLVSRDAPGIPLDWLFYWPFALVLQVVLASISSLYLRVHKHFRAQPAAARFQR